MTRSAAMASSSPTVAAVLILLLCAFTTSASAATFTITNNCSFTVWPAAIPVGGGLQLNPGKTWTLEVPIGTNGGSIWGRTGCSFNSSGNSGHCATGDCSGALSCQVLGQAPLTSAEFTIGSAADYYDISVIDGYNLPMDFSCSSGRSLQCRDPSCLDAYHFPGGPKLPQCSGNSSYLVTFCP